MGSRPSRADCNGRLWWAAASGIAFVTSTWPSFLAQRPPPAVEMQISLVSCLRIAQLHPQLHPAVQRRPSCAAVSGSTTTRLLPASDDKASIRTAGRGITTFSTPARPHPESSISIQLMSISLSGGHFRAITTCLPTCPHAPPSAHAHHQHPPFRRNS
jgi:hypothetical protein